MRNTRNVVGGSVPGKRPSLRAQTYLGQESTAFGTENFEKKQYELNILFEFDLQLDNNSY